MDYLTKIREELFARGYTSISAAVVAAHGDLWLCHQSSTTSVNHVLYLSYKPNAQAYGVHAGIFDPRVHAEIGARLDRLSPFIEHNYLESPFLIDRPCWNLFDAGRALKWGALYVIPTPRDPISWPGQLDSLFSDFLEPTFLSIADANGIMELLLRNDPPFEWFLTNPVLRIAELVGLGRVAGADAELLRSRIDAYAKISARRIPEGQYNRAVDLIFERLFS